MAFHPHGLHRQAPEATGITPGRDIILASFAAKDWRGDQIKELAASIQAAEHAFDTRSDQRRTYTAIWALRAEFETFATDPAKSLWASVRKQQTARSSELDAATEDDIEQTYSSSTQLLKDITRLRSKLSHEGQNSLRIAELKQEAADLDVKISAVTRLSDQTSNQRPRKKDAFLEVNQQLADLDNAVTHFSDKVDDLSRQALPTADDELESDERRSQVWAWIYDGLFIFGWLVTVAGILLGGSDEKTVVERLAGG